MWAMDVVIQTFGSVLSGWAMAVIVAVRWTADFDQRIQTSEQEIGGCRSFSESCLAQSQAVAVEVRSPAACTTARRHGCDILADVEAHRMDQHRVLDCALERLLVIADAVEVAWRSRALLCCVC